MKLAVCADGTFHSPDAAMTLPGVAISEYQSANCNVAVCVAPPT